MPKSDPRDVKRLSSGCQKANFGMPKGDPRDGPFYSTVTYEWLILILLLNHPYTFDPLNTGNFATSEDPDEMQQHNAAFHKGLHTKNHN